MQRKEIRYLASTPTRINSRWIRDVNARIVNMKLLDIGIENGSLENSKCKKQKQN